MNIFYFSVIFKCFLINLLHYLKDYSDIIGAFIGTIGAFLVALFTLKRQWKKDEKNELRILFEKEKFLLSQLDGVISKFKNQYKNLKEYIEQVKEEKIQTYHLKSSSGYDTHLKNIHSLKEFEYYKILVENRNDKFKLYYYNQFSLHLDFLHTINKKLKIDFDEYNKKFQDTQDMWKMNYEKIVDSINYFRKIQPNDFSVSILQTWSDYHNKNAENNSRLDPYFIKKNLFPELLAVSRTFANVDFIILIQRAIHSFNNLNYQRELYLMDLKSIAFYSKSSCLRLMIVKKFYER